MTYEDLKKYLIKCGLEKVASCRIVDREFKIKIFDPEPEIVTHGKCIYVFLMESGYIRVGSTKAPLKKRLRNYELHITHALRREKSPAPDEEATKWRMALSGGKSGTVYAREGTRVKTRVQDKPFPTYLDEESLLIGKMFDEWPHDLIINRNKHRLASNITTTKSLIGFLLGIAKR